MVKKGDDIAFHVKCVECTQPMEEIDSTTVEGREHYATRQCSACGLIVEDFYEYKATVVREESEEDDPAFDEEVDPDE